ncbi:hypothetical protein HDR58_01250 [bacterium]|nr:hypothetical protein [bacterium]
MKKIWILFLIFSFITCPTFGCNMLKNKPITHSNGTIEYNFLKQKQVKPSKILYRFVLKELGKTPKEAQDLANIKLKTVSAFETDLNDDGKKEIIGIIFSTYYSGTAGTSLFILEKQNNVYQNIAKYMINIETNKNFYVLPNKTNGYKDIIFYSSSAFDFKSMRAKFNSKYYYNYEQDEKFKNYLKDFSNYNVSEITNIKGK